jgi:hypothetical protein
MDALQAGESVELRGFGRFQLRHRQPRAGRNPRTGETVQILVAYPMAADNCRGPLVNCLSEANQPVVRARSPF